MSLTLLDHLVKLHPTAKRTTLRRMIESGRVTINGKPARTLKQALAESDVVATTDKPKSPASDTRKVALPFPIIHEDADLLVIDKPPGLLTSTGPREKRPTVLAMVREYVRSNDPKSQVGLIHRLDRDASGLLVFSKNHDAYLSLKRQFFDHAVQRIYLAIVDGVPTPRNGTIDSYLVERADGTVYSSDQRKGERAITHYETIADRRAGGKRRSHLRVKLETGKKHQIRVHLSERDVPIVNDSLYHSKKPDGRLMLAAVELTLSHPRTKKTVTFQIDPVELRELVSHE